MRSARPAGTAAPRSATRPAPGAQRWPAASPATRCGRPARPPRPGRAAAAAAAAWARASSVSMRDPGRTPRPTASRRWTYPSPLSAVLTLARGRQTRVTLFCYLLVAPDHAAGIGGGPSAIRSPSGGGSHARNIEGSSDQQRPKTAWEVAPGGTYGHHGSRGEHREPRCAGGVSGGLAADRRTGTAAPRRSAKPHRVADRGRASRPRRVGFAGRYEAVDVRPRSDSRGVRNEARRRARGGRTAAGSPAGLAETVGRPLAG